MYPSRQRIVELLDYNPETREFTRCSTGKRAEVATPEGYLLIRLDGHSLSAHRLAWIYFYGEAPPKMIDHKDGDKANNRIANLRPANNSQNGANSERPSNNTSGFKGVCLYRKLGRYAARITFKGKSHHLGMYDTPEEAHAAYVHAATAVWGEYARAG